MLTRRTGSPHRLVHRRAGRARHSAFAQDYPSKPVRVIVPYAAGGATDTLARLLATRIDQELKQSVVIDNRGGGASQVGTQAVATAPPDGYTIGMIDSRVHDQSRPVRRQAALRHAQGLRADLADRDRAAGVRGASFGRGEERAGAGRAREAEARHDLCAARPRHAGASRRRAVAPGGRHRGGVGAVSRRRAVDRGLHRRTGADDVRDRAVDPRACARRARPRARHGGRALAAAARCADHGGGRPCRRRCRR